MVRIYTPSPTPINRNEVLRYMGAKSGDEQTEKLIDTCLNELDGKISARLCFEEFSISKLESGLDLGFTKTYSKLAAKHLSGCSKVILFAATVGVEIDRLIAKYTNLSPSKALAFQAIGAERIEAVCDEFEEKIRLEYPSCAKRISPGYGDIPLEMQRDIFAALDCSRKIGLALNESLLMSPTKSVTALIAIKESL